MHRRELGAAAHSIHELVGRQSELEECAAVALRVDRIRKVPQHFPDPVLGITRMPQYLCRFGMRNQPPLLHEVGC